MKRHLLLFLIFLSFSLTEHCKKKERKFSLALCKDLAESECIPPLIGNEVVYYFDKAKTENTVEDYLNSVYFAGDTLSFHFKNLDKYKEANTNFGRDFSASYSFTGVENRTYTMARVDILENSIIGLNSVGEIFLNYYHKKKQLPYYKLAPITVRYEFFLKKKRFAFRTVSILLKNE